MAASNRVQPLLLHTYEGLLLQVVHERQYRFERWTATLHLQPDCSLREAGVSTGAEVARAWSEQPPTFLDMSEYDTPAETVVFFDKALFSLPEDQAQALHNYILQQTAPTAEAC